MASAPDDHSFNPLPTKNILMVRQVGILYCRQSDPDRISIGWRDFSFFLLLFCYASDGIYAVDPVT